MTASIEVRGRSGLVVRKAEPTPITPGLNGALVRMAGIGLDGLDEGLYDLMIEVEDEVGGGRIERHEPFSLTRKEAPP